jgi:hypothetical protein
MNFIYTSPIIKIKNYKKNKINILKFINKLNCITYILYS